MQALCANSGGRSARSLCEAWADRVRHAKLMFDDGRMDECRLAIEDANAYGVAMNALQPLSRREIVIAGAMREKVRSALDLWLSGFSSENTRRAYAREIAAFAAFAGHEDAATAVAHFLALEDGQAHASADAWRTAKIERGLSPASVNRSMSAINSLVAYARRVGITKLRLESKGVKSKAYRNTRGPGLRGVQSILAVAQDQGSGMQFPQRQKAIDCHEVGDCPMNAAYLSALAALAG